jgi:hypothetical protein
MPALGYHLSEKAKRKLSLDHLGKRNPMFGKHFSKERIRKISKRLKKQWKNKKYRVRQTESLKLAWKEGRQKGNTGKHPTEKTRRKLSMVHKKAWQKKEYKEKMRLMHLGKEHPHIGHFQTKFTRRKMSEGNKNHRKAVLEEMKNYKKQRFTVFDTDRVHPDFIARLGNKDIFYAVEVEFKPLTSDKCVHKYDDVNIFNDIHWIQRK